MGISAVRRKLIEKSGLVDSYRAIDSLAGWIYYFRLLVARLVFPGDVKRSLYSIVVVDHMQMRFLSHIVAESSNFISSIIHPNTFTHLH